MVIRCQVAVFGEGLLQAEWDMEPPKNGPIAVSFQLRPSANSQFVQAA